MSGSERIPTPVKVPKPLQVKTEAPVIAMKGVENKQEGMPENSNKPVELNSPADLKKVDDIVAAADNGNLDEHDGIKKLSTILDSPDNVTTEPVVNLENDSQPP